MATSSTKRCLRACRNSFPQKIAVKIAYDNAVAHKIEAGSDMFLMPSKYEPCGLNQIYSLKYGTVPIVRATGGLDDTIEPWDARTGKGTGFKFTDYSGEALLLTIKEALKAFRDRIFLADAHAQWHEQRFLLERFGQGVCSGLRTGAAGAGCAESGADGGIGWWRMIPQPLRRPTDCPELIPIQKWNRHCHHK